MVEITQSIPAAPKNDAAMEGEDKKIEEVKAEIVEEDAKKPEVEEDSKKPEEGVKANSDVQKNSEPNVPKPNTVKVAKVDVEDDGNPPEMGKQNKNNH